MASYTEIRFRGGIPYEVTGGGAGGSGISGAPAVWPLRFPPEDHTQGIGSVTGLQEKLDLLSVLQDASLLFAEEADPRPSSDPTRRVFWKAASSDPAGAFAGDIVLKGTGSGLTQLFLEGYTGSNGAAWNASNWSNQRLTTAATATIQGNKGQLFAGSATAYAGGVTEYYPTNKLDAEWRGTFQFTNAVDGMILFSLRGEFSGVYVHTGYFLQLGRGGTVRITKSVAFTETVMATLTQSLATTTDYEIRFRVEGAQVKAKLWTGSTEPSAWTMEATDPSGVLGTGKASVELRGGSAASATALFDNVSLSELTSGGTLTLSVVP